MRERTQRVRTLTSAMLQELRAENVTFMAGSIAYHAFVSLLPLLLLLVLVAATFGNSSIEDAIIELAGSVLSRGAGDALVAELKASAESRGISVLGMVVLLWGTLRIFRGLDTAFSDIYETEEQNTFVDQIVDGVAVLVTVGLAIVLGGILQRAAVGTGLPVVDWAVGQALGVLGLALAFLPMYYIFPDVDVTLREVVPGTLFCAIGLATFEGLFGLYLRYSGRAEGASGDLVTGVVVLLTWLYFTGLVILLGAVINAVLANRSRDVNVVPVFGSRDSQTSVRLPRDRLSEVVDDVDRLLTDHDEVTLVAGGEEVTIPAPTHLISDTQASLLFTLSRPVRLELQWTPARPGDDGAAAGDAEATADDGGTTGDDGGTTGDDADQQPAAAED